MNLRIGAKVARAGADGRGFIVKAGHEGPKMTQTNELVAEQTFGVAHSQGKRDKREVAMLRPISTDRTIGFTGPLARTCQWIENDPRLDATKCGRKAQAESSYCPEHRARCYYATKAPQIKM